MTIATLGWMLLGIGSAAVMMLASRSAVANATALAARLRVPTFLVGATLMAIGTDMPELVNSVVSSYLGHGDINVGDSIGSVFNQSTLVLGLFPIAAGTALVVRKREVLLVCGLTIIALVVGLLLLRDGAISRIDALTLVLIWVAATVIAALYGGGASDGPEVRGPMRGFARHLAAAVAALAVVGVAAYGLVRAIEALALGFGIPEYILGFFAASLGTSMPELAVELTSLRRKQQGLALGDVFGSCLVDASLSLGLGPLLFPTPVTAGLATRGALLAVAAVAIAALLVGARGRHGRVTGATLIALYLAAYFALLS